MPIKITSNAPRRKHFIKDWRKFRGMTQGGVAAKLDTTKASISRIELGEQPYTQDSLEGLANALNCSVSDLLTRHPKMKPEWSIFDLPSGDQEQVYNFIRGLRLAREGSTTAELRAPASKQPRKK